MKKIASILISLCLMVSAFPLGMFTASAATSGYYTYTVENGEATITEVRTSISGHVKIPATLGGYPVTSIGMYAFGWCSSMTSVEIPNTVTSLESYAFNLCTKLTSVKIPDSVTSLGIGVFHMCSGLTDVEISSGLTSIAPYMFQDCSSLTSVTIPNRVTHITPEAFDGCSSLQSVTLASSVTAISESAFRGCSSLTDVWYFGTDKADISIASYNTALENATWHYISTCPNAHRYAGVCDDTCDVCGGTRAASAHTYDNACDAACNGCGFVRTVPDHVYTDVCDTACNVCDLTRTAPHAYENACDTDCNVCGSVRKVSAHVYDDACDTACNTCGFVRTASDHVYDNACDAACNICGATRTVPNHTYTVNSAHTCGECGHSITPAAPVVAQKTNRRVTLVKIDGLEYSKNGVNWQDSPVFDNLAADTTYTFYQRVKASNASQVSGISDGTVVTFKSAQATLSAPMAISFTDTVVTLSVVSGAEYSMDGVRWQAGSTFTDLLPGTTYTFYQRLAETATHEAGDSSDACYLTTDKAAQTAVPDAPTLQSVNTTTVVLQAVSGCEYSKDGKTWQSDPVFENLQPITSYTFYQRYKETATHYAGKMSVGATFTTDKAVASAPSVPTLKSKTHNTVKLAAHDGYEYSIGGVEWQTSAVFTGLTPETNYLVYQRVAETDTHYASAASSALIVKTEAHPLFDEVLDTIDARYTLKSTIGLTGAWTADEIAFADVNKDGKVTTTDVRQMLAMIVFESQQYEEKSKPFGLAFFLYPFRLHFFSARGILESKLDVSWKSNRKGEGT